MKPGILAGIAIGLVSVFLICGAFAYDREGPASCWRACEKEFEACKKGQAKRNGSLQVCNENFTRCTTTCRDAYR